MRLLIDTHVIIWWVMAPDTLSKTVDDLLLDPATQVLVSPVSAFEISRKYGLGKLAFDQAFINMMPDFRGLEKYPEYRELFRPKG